MTESLVQWNATNYPSPKKPGREKRPFPHHPKNARTSSQAYRDVTICSHAYRDVNGKFKFFRLISIAG